jgi:hypothetical protein
MQHADKRAKGRQVLFVQYPQFIDSDGHTQPLLRWPCALMPPSPTHRDWLLQIVPSLPPNGIPIGPLPPKPCTRTRGANAWPPAYGAMIPP